MSDELKNEKEASVKPKEEYPKAIYFILGNELCERFTFYGIQAILTIYLTEEFKYSDSLSTTIYHAWSLLCYFTPIFGAILADSWFGKFRTIFVMGVIYSIGNIITSVGSIPRHLQAMKILTFLGLILIACGTGGIKPCIAAFGGDQFSKNQLEQRKTFFSIFYFFINVGSFLSTAITPILRVYVKCSGVNTCYPLAFGVPAILMVLSMIIFVLGKPLYKNKIPDQNVLLTFVKCVGHAVVQRFKSKKKDKEHWLDYAEDLYDKKFIRDAKYMLRIWFIYLPLPLFWTLFHQQGSRWTLQARKLNGRVNGFEILPDQMKFLNPIFILIFIPLFNYVIYPLLEKVNCLTTPLQRVTTGFIFAALSFLVAGFLEKAIEKNQSNLLEVFSETNIVNMSPCLVNITALENTSLSGSKLGINQWTFIPSNCIENNTLFGTFNTTPTDELILITIEDGNLKIQADNNIIVNKINSELLLSNSAKNSSTFLDDNALSYHTFNNRTEELKNQSLPKRFLLDSYKVSLVKSTSISMLYQIPQYIILTAGEIMFSISGLEFSYSQAPISMKSVVQASWLLTTAFGNLIMMIISEIDLFEKQSWEFFAFTIIMFLDVLVFGVMAHFYEYVNIEDSDDNVEPELQDSSSIEKK